MGSLEDAIINQTLATGALTDRMGQQLIKYASDTAKAAELSPAVVNSLLENEWISSQECDKVASILSDHAQTLELLAELSSRRPLQKSAMGSVVPMDPGTTAVVPRSLGARVAGKTEADLAFERRLDAYPLYNQ